jgi:hypothetical protein
MSYRQPPQASLILGYLVFGSIALSALLFTPFAKKMQPTPSAPNTTTPVASVQQPAPAAQNNTCYAINSLSTDQAGIVDSLLQGNQLVSNIKTNTTASKFGLAVVMPNDVEKREALMKLVAAQGVDTSRMVTLSNKNKAWPVGVFTDAAQANAMKTSLASKGVWNMTVDNRPSVSQIQFYSTSTELIGKLNEYLKTRNIAEATVCN